MFSSRFPGGTPIIPWKSDVAATLTRDFGEAKTWISREGIVLLTGEHSFTSFLRVPSPINIFSSMAESLGYKLELSPAGRTCEQMIHAPGSIRAMGLVARGPELLKFLDRLAREDLEVELEGEEGDGAKKKKLHKSFAPLPQIVEILERANANRFSKGSRHLDALIRSHVLKLGMALRCGECQHTSWFSLESLKPRMSCPHCLKKFSFPSGSPPQRNQWAYRVIGPFYNRRFRWRSILRRCSIEFPNREGAALDLGCHLIKVLGSQLTAQPNPRSALTTNPFNLESHASLVRGTLLTNAIPSEACRTRYRFVVRWPSALAMPRTVSPALYRRQSSSRSQPRRPSSASAPRRSPCRTSLAR
jgi:hypothetical protein